jgi:acetolactate synthase regulatory subunit
MSGDGSSNGQHPQPAHTSAPPPRALPGTGTAQRHILVVLVMNRPGVLNRVASLMRARNFNIDSLAVSHTDSDEISRMTITLHGDDVAVEQAAKQLTAWWTCSGRDVAGTSREQAGLRKVRANDEPGRGHQDRRAVQGGSSTSPVGDRRGDRDRGEIDALVARCAATGSGWSAPARVMLRGASSSRRH